MMMASVFDFIAHPNYEVSMRMRERDPAAIAAGLSYRFHILGTGDSQPQLLAGQSSSDIVKLALPTVE
jgi:hypothetical protein